MFVPDGFYAPLTSSRDADSSKSVRLGSGLTTPFGRASQLRTRLEAGIDVLFVCGPSPEPLVLLSRLFPKSRFVAVSDEAERLNAAEAAANEAGVTNIVLKLSDAQHASVAARYDLIVLGDDRPSADFAGSGIEVVAARVRPTRRERKRRAGERSNANGDNSGRIRCQSPAAFAA